MADQIRQTKNAINSKKQEIQAEEAVRSECAGEVANAQEMVATSSGEDRAAAAEMLKELKTMLSMSEANLERLNSELAALESQLPQDAEPTGPKFDPSKHPLLRKTLEKQEPEQAVVFSTGDVCEAQWTDRAWYKAKIQSILGSVSAPKYLVRFVDYDETMTVDRDQVRPLPSKRKREPESVATPTPSAPVTSTPHVISGPASMNPSAQAAKNNGAADEESKKTSRVPSKGLLKKRATNWQDFTAKTAKKGIIKKESQFRTSTEAGSRVGFTGSGKGMTETHKRKRYDHKADAEQDEDYSTSTPQSRKRF